MLILLPKFTYCFCKLFTRKLFRKERVNLWQTKRQHLALGQVVEVASMEVMYYLLFCNKAASPQGKNVARNNHSFVF